MNENKNNLWLFDKYAQPPKEALKDFNNGNFKGTDINTMWRIKCLTETFGECGFGWYYEIDDVWTENLLDPGEAIITYAKIKLYIKNNGEWSKAIAGVGGNKSLSWVKPKDSKEGYWKPNDEAVKMAVTDALGNACRNLGFGSKIYWANDRTKYTAESEQTEQKTTQKAQKQQTNYDEIPTNEHLARLRELGGSINVVADFYKVGIDQVTDAMVVKMIEAKERSLAKAK